MNATAALQVNDRFTKRADRTYRVDGQRRTHGLLLLCEVTGLVDGTYTTGGFTYRVVEVLEETNRPDFDGVYTPAEGTISWFGWDAAKGRGDVTTVA